MGTLCVSVSKGKLPKKLSGIHPSWSISHYLFLIGEADTVTHPEQVTRPSQDTHSHTHTWHSITPTGHLNLGMFLECQREHENGENPHADSGNMLTPCRKAMDLLTAQQCRYLPPHFKSRGFPKPPAPVD